MPHGDAAYKAQYFLSPRRIFLNDATMFKMPQAHGGCICYKKGNNAYQNLLAEKAV